MLRSHTGRARHAASLALTMLLLGAPTAASAAEDEGSVGGDVASSVSSDGHDDSDDRASGSEFDLASLGIVDIQRTFGQQLRIVTLDVLGTAAIGGVILHQLTGGRRMAMTAAARVLPTGELLDIAAGGGQVEIDEPTIVTPEPGTVALMGTGLAVLGVVAYRRSRRVPQRLPHRCSHRRRV